MQIEMMIWVLLFGMLLLGVPIFVALGASTVVVLFFSDLPFAIIPLDLFKVSDMFPLLAVPAFILAGGIMEKGGIASRIVEFCEILIGGVRGGLGIVTILACMFFAAIIGSGPGTVAAVGSLMIPSMLRRGYSVDYASGVVSTGGTLGILIPPSNPMILYGVVANVSITSLFMAGIIPGIIVGLMLILTAYVLARRAGYKASEKKYNVSDFFVCLRRSFWSLMSPVLVLGGIYAGIFTPVEASCVAVVYAIVIGAVVNRELKWRDFIQCVNNTNLVVSTMVIVVGVSVLFGRFLTMYQVPQKATYILLGLTEDPYMVLFLLVGFLFVLGMFMDTLATIVILGPILLPVITHFGIDPIFFGILWVMANEVALLSPPLGPNVFIAMNLTGISLERASKAIIPYTIVLIGIILLMVRFGEDLILFLPRLFGR